MSKRTRKKNSEETVEAVVRDILGPDVTVEAVGGVDVEPPADSVAELSDALEALNAGGAAGGGEESERQTWAERVDPAGLASEDEVESAGEEREVVIHDADAEDRDEERARLRDEGGDAAADGEVAPGGQPRELAELMAVCEALIFVSDEPLSAKALADVLKEERGWVQVAVEELAKEYAERGGGLMLREVAGGWQLATRPEHHDSVRAFLKSKPSAKLSLAALETLAVIAYKQPVTVPEILEIRGVQSSSAIKTLLDKRLIVAKGRKETVGRPMMYGTSKEFLMQFGLRDLGELPNVEDFEDLAAGGEG
ncbi:MAG TPA: SMC-Scp complex subunit ScpB [Pyrinomonadaceae bacterium]|nr:SMC-Scp complex subunit ScpB [Pyrinomonadaceae bacterium]